MFNKLRNKKLAKQIGKLNKTCIGANQSVIKIFGTCVVKIKMRILIECYFFDFQGFSCELNLGSCFIRESGILVDLRLNVCYFSFNP